MNNSHNNKSTDQVRKELEQDVWSKFGFVPNNFQALLESPLAAKIYLSAVDHKKDFSTLNFKERSLVDYVVSLHHKDEYFIAMHKNFLLQKAEVPSGELALYEWGTRQELEQMGREGWVVIATRYILLHHGRELTAGDLQVFEENGVSREVWCEIATYVGLKMTGNIVNNLVKPTLDAEFQ